MELDRLHTVKCKTRTGTTPSQVMKVKEEAEEKFISWGKYLTCEIPAFLRKLIKSYRVKNVLREKNLKGTSTFQTDLLTNNLNDITNVFYSHIYITGNSLYQRKNPMKKGVSKILQTKISLKLAF